MWKKGYVIVPTFTASHIYPGLCDILAISSRYCHGGAYGSTTVVFHWPWSLLGTFRSFPDGVVTVLDE